MQTPANYDFKADRYAQFIETVVFLQKNLIGATFAMQVRDRWNGGALRADLTTVSTASAEGVRLISTGNDTMANHVAAGRLTEEDVADAGYALTDSVLLSEIGIRINKSTMSAMPLAPQVEDDKTLYWNLKVTPSGGLEEVYARGQFIVRAGATQ